jgi:hypothetical protein
MMEVIRIAMSVISRSWAIAGAIHLLFISTAPTAKASPSYPPEIQNQLQLPSQPPCTICHTSNLGGTGTAVTKFAMAMKAAGLTGGSQTGLLDNALVTLEADPTGKIYIQDLKDGLDPNTGNAQPDVPTPKYGCGARIAAGSVRPNAEVTLAAALFAMVLLSRRRVR